jgi:hypothetical protein
MWRASCSGYGQSDVSLQAQAQILMSRLHMYPSYISSEYRRHTNDRPALRRKFLELYHLPTPPSINSISRATSPSNSPTSPKTTFGHSNRDHRASPSMTFSPDGANNAGTEIGTGVRSNPNPNPDPFTAMVTELVKLIQAALALWGMFGTDRQDLEIDGLFCDETKAGIFQWRRMMGMEHEESLRMEVGAKVKLDAGCSRAILLV